MCDQQFIILIHYTYIVLIYLMLHKTLFKQDTISVAITFMQYLNDNLQYASAIKRVRYFWQIEIIKWYILRGLNDWHTLTYDISIKLQMLFIHEMRLNTTYRCNALIRLSLLMMIFSIMQRKSFWIVLLSRYMLLSQ